MGILNDIKWIHLVKKVEGKYKTRFDELTSSIKNLSGDQQVPIDILQVFRALLFCKKLNQFLFLSKNGVFKNDIGKLNSQNYDTLYQTELIFFSWMITPFDLDGKKNQQHINFWFLTFEKGFGMDLPFVKSCYKTCSEQGQHESISANTMVYCLFYKACILIIKHKDKYFEEVNISSPDLIEFLASITLATEESSKIFDKNEK